jgi:hypothetical protein
LLPQTSRPQVRPSFEREKACAQGVLCRCGCSVLRVRHTCRYDSLYAMSLAEQSGTSLRYPSVDRLTMYRISRYCPRCRPTAAPPVRAGEVARLLGMRRMLRDAYLAHAGAVADRRGHRGPRVAECSDALLGIDRCRPGEYPCYEVTLPFAPGFLDSSAALMS